MESRLAPVIAARRLSSLGAHGASMYDAVFVMSPHRLNARMLRYLNSKCDKLFAVLGDDPVGARSVRDDCWQEFDGVLAADESWLRNVPPSYAPRVVMPWGSTLIDPNLLSGEPYVPKSVVLVGTPYPERVALARHLLRKTEVTLQGDEWPAIPGAKLRPSSSRQETLSAIRENRELVINIHHSQFTRGLNPQFFDYAAAGIPQLVVHADDLLRYRLGWAGQQFEGSLDDDELISDPKLHEQNLKIISLVRDKYLFHACVERAYNEN